MNNEGEGIQKNVDPMHNSEIFRNFVSENQFTYETAENGTNSLILPR